jgi:pRiA4b ORF-3-like protein
MSDLAAARRITAKTQVLQLKIQLADIRPPVWRRVLVPAEIDLGALHEVIQTACGWSNCHLHQLEIGTASYGPRDPDGETDDVADESRAKLFRLVAVGDQLDYGRRFDPDAFDLASIDAALAALA